MAAYAAVVSLMTTIDSIQNHPLHSLSLDTKHIQSLHGILNLLLNFIETYNCRRGSKGDEELESRIASAAHAAEDVLEFHVVDRIHAADYGETSPISMLDLEAVIEELDCVKEMVMEFQVTKEFTDLQFCSPLFTSSKPLIAAKDVMVGFDEELIQIMDRLTGPQPDLQIVPIVGMGGIGKTTLANNVYQNLLIVQHFDIRAWATISQKYSVMKILSEINKTLGAFDSEMDQETIPDEDELGLKLYQTLWGRRYLIVLDDIWSIEIWDKLRCFFPSNDCRSRIIVTTRISNVATLLSSSSFEMNFLDEDKSWELFCGKTFLEEGCPQELEEIGKKIVRDCKGLPLSISVIGGLLRKSRTQEYWQSVAKDTNSMLMLEKDEHCLDILLLSYNHLPAHLKPCFLYMGVFRENHVVYISKLIKHFVAEGFLKPNKPKSLEEIAGGYLNDLVDRNLVLVESRRWKGTIKYLRMHDLVREVCLRIAEKEKFLYKIRVIENPADISTERRIVVYHRTHLKMKWPQLFDALPTASLVRAFKSDGVPLPLKCRLLRVLHNARFESMEAICQHVNLRYLAYNQNWKFHPLELPSKLPSSVSLLWNLQTLVMKRRVHVPVEIWNMRQLRHLRFKKVFFPVPPPSNQQDDLVLQNLQTLSRVMNFGFTEEVCKRIPNITKLRIRYDDFSGECQQKSYYYLKNLVNLLKLESLECSFYHKPERDDLLQSLAFPRSLRKLSLRYCHLRWKDLETYGFSLPHLEVLKLDLCAFVGPEWDCVEGAFPSLRFLNICDANLMEWSAKDSDFPKLERLHLQNMNLLEKIPSGVGDIPTLQYLHVYWCSESASLSATEILEEQRSFGNDYLQVKVVMRKTRA